jgi:hypothetical protein
VAHAQLWIVGQQRVDADQDGVVGCAQGVRQRQRLAAAEREALPGFKRDAAVEALRPRQRDERAPVGCTAAFALVQLFQYPRDDVGRGFRLQVGQKDPPEAAETTAATMPSR